jgi:hypothetical protein
MLFQLEWNKIQLNESQWKKAHVTRTKLLEKRETKFIMFRYLKDQVALFIKLQLVRLAYLNYVTIVSF